MQNRPPIISLLTLACGLLAAVILLVASNPICNYLQAKRLAKHATSHANSVAGGLQAKLDQLQDFTNEIGAAPSLAEDDFSQKAAKLIEAIPEIHSVEWIPLVEPGVRSEIEADLKNRIAQTPITTARRAGSLEVPPNKPIRPVLFVYPLNKRTKAHLGSHRPSWPARSHAEKTGKPFISGKAKYYLGDRQRKAIYVPVTVDGKSNRSGALFLMHHLFPDKLSNPTTICVVADVTSKNPWLQSDGQPNSGPTSIKESNTACVIHQRIGGRMFRFRVIETASANLRPIWIPWLLFFASNLTATLIAIQSYRKESQQLLVRNQQLQHEISRRSAIERQLQGTLDFRDQERELIAHDIHDGFVQDVIGAQMYAEALAANDPTAKVISDVLVKAIQEARQTIDYLKPRVVDEVGLIAALEDSIAEDQQRYDFDARLDVTPEFPRLPLFVERMLYRMVHEALCNARQHSGADEAYAALTCDESNIVIEVTDQGKGFELEEVQSDCFGLAGIRHRAEVLNGVATVKANEFGTKVVIEIPRDVDFPEPPSNVSLRIRA